MSYIEVDLNRFRPQQGLTIMNFKMVNLKKGDNKMFPSPTGVNYYEFLPTKP